MIDERIRIQENYDMAMETAIDEAREEGLEQGLEQGLERGRYYDWAVTSPLPLGDG